MYPTLNLTRIRKAAAILSMVLVPAFMQAQAVTEIITDYSGYWKSGALLVNPVKPDNSHNLLAFSYNGVRYSTGANDELLRQRGDSFKQGDFKALPVSSLTGIVNSNTKIGLGAMYDGVYNGASAVKPENKLAKYLADGINGLDLGTCVANLPVGDIYLPVTNLKASAIGDGIPDLLITQIADASSGSLDRYEFIDMNGNRVGNAIDIILSTLPVVGNWTADFYEASTNPTSLSAGFTQTDRPIRMWAADFSAFGITAAQLSQLAYFKIRLNGNSDVAFVAYNNNTVDIIAALPVSLASFTAKSSQNEVDLAWKTTTELFTAQFSIEHSRDGVSFSSIGQVMAAGNSTDPRQYNYTHKHVAAGKNYYRLKIVDKNGSFTHSEMVVVTINATTGFTLNVYPNPTTETINIRQSSTDGNDVFQVRNLAGILMIQKTFAAGSTQNQIDVKSLSAGTYLLIRVRGSQQEMIKFIKH